jgi:glycine C-acetyltransferase
MRTLETALRAELESMREAGTLKRMLVLTSPQGPAVEVEGHGELLCLCSNDYLGLANHPAVVAAAAEGLERYGVGTASVRFICGKFAPHVELERELARFLAFDAALTYTSCWNANQALIDTLADERTAILSDRLNHASIIDGVRLGRPGFKAVYEHCDPEDLERKLAGVPPDNRVLVVTDGVFSMEGDLAPLPELLSVTERHGATLIVDDSHGLGVIGGEGRGVCEHFECLDRDDVIVTGTLGKALGGASGGFVAGSEALCEVLEQRSRAQLFSNGLPPAVACGARRALTELCENPGLLQQLRDNTARFRRGVEAIGLRPLEGESAIVPVVVGETAVAIRFSDMLIERGVYVTGFGYPIVPEGTARVRAQLSAALSDEQIDTALAAFSEVAAELGLATSAKSAL